ncbi:phage major capsid protein [Nocardia flavorosea]|uniref:Phage major capsid protein n=1 Tax=Nocardia flavorosea TaxID=53429 RepID=A0A846YHQ0_9NOCA|nr:phage major capsid protein [Nocardia flavorosea]NKY57230.1 phage major capsid protein [Nocardia flavorosea]
MAAVSHTSTGVATAFTPDDVAALVVQPAIQMSVAMQAATVVPTDSTSLRFPIITDDPSGSWVAEGAEIPVSDAESDEIVVTPSKLATLTVISSELADDGSPEAQQVIGDGIARDVAKKIDAAFFGNTTTNGPSGLLSITGVQTVDTGASITNTDVFADALSKAETVGAVITTFVANPADILTLAKVKKATGSNEPLLGNDPTQPTQRTVLGVPLVPSAAVSAGTIWAIPRDRVFIVLRKDTSIMISEHSHFTSDRVSIRAITRAGFGFPHPGALVRMHDAA